MAQNRSAAVMQQRHEANDSLEDFPTPPWATRALCNFIARYSPVPLGDLTCREPCANRGHMLRPLQEYFRSIDAFDVHDYGLGLPERDFLFLMEPLDPVDWTFINPPFRLAEEFIDRALATSIEGVVVICRSAFLEGERRYERLFSQRPPSYVLQFSERVVMLKGRLVQSGAPDPSEDNPERKAGTASAASALVWFKKISSNAKLFDWIAPCRRELEVEGDYPETPNGLARLHRAIL